MRLASRMSTIGTESAFEVAARARALEATGRSVIHLEIGEPDFDTPANVREAAKRALDEGFTHYAPFPGIHALREAIAEDATARKGFAVTLTACSSRSAVRASCFTRSSGSSIPVTRSSSRILATRSTNRWFASSAAGRFRSRSG